MNRVCWVLGSLWSCLLAAVAALYQGGQSNRARVVCSIFGQVTPPHFALIPRGYKERPTRFSAIDRRGQKRFDNSAKRTGTLDSGWVIMSTFRGCWGPGSFYTRGSEFRWQIPGGRGLFHRGLTRAPDRAMVRGIFFLAKSSALTRGLWITSRRSLGFLLLAAS